MGGGILQTALTKKLPLELTYCVPTTFGEEQAGFSDWQQAELEYFKNDDSVAFPGLVETAIQGREV